MNEIKICEYTNNDRWGCVKLLEKTFPGLSGEENFIWRFESTMNEPLIVCAKHNDKIVGFHSYMPWRFNFKNRQYIGYQGGEAATDRNYRGQGIQNKLVKHACELAIERDIDFLFGASGMPATLKTYYRSGFYQVAYFSLRQKLVSPFSRKHSETEVIEVRQPLKIMLSEENKITPIVDDKYIEWRYSLNPKDYSIIQIEKDNNQALFCVRRRKQRMYLVKISDLLVLDCQFSSLNDRFIKWAFKALESVFSKKVMTISIYFSENTDRGRAISRYFTWKRYNYDQALMLLPIKKDLDLNVFLNHNNWDVLSHIVDWY